MIYKTTLADNTQEIIDDAEIRVQQVESLAGFTPKNHEKLNHTECVTNTYDLLYNVFRTSYMLKSMEYAQLVDEEWIKDHMTQQQACEIRDLLSRFDNIIIKYNNVHIYDFIHDDFKSTNLIEEYKNCQTNEQLKSLFDRLVHFFHEAESMLTYFIFYGNTKGCMFILSDISEIFLVMDSINPKNIDKYQNDKTEKRKMDYDFCYQKTLQDIWIAQKIMNP